MAKSSKSRRAQTGDVYDSKPDFAMDLFAPDRPKKKTPEAEKAGPEVVSVGDRLGSDARSLLEKLRKDMEAQAAATTNAPTAAPVKAGHQGRPAAGTKQAREPEKNPADPNLTFAEMFDPQPEDDVDFDQMLEDSKLDWREYK